jgi:hypothetical protein
MEECMTTAEDPPRTDWFLQGLVSLATRVDMDYPVTLSVGGLLISGHVISGKRYFECLACEVVSGLGDVDPAIKEAFAKIKDLGEMYSAPVEGESGLRELERPEYIHLQNARIFHPGMAVPIPTNRGMLWRGRLDAIDGFTLGALGSGQSHQSGSAAT